MTTAKDAANTVETLTADAQKAAADQFEKLAKSFEDVAAFGQENLDAFAKSSAVAVKAAEEMNAECVSFSKKAMEDGVAAMKDFSSIRTMPELMEKQATYAKSSVDGFVKQAAKVNELYMAAAKEVFAPMSDRASAAADLVKGFRA